MSHEFDPRLALERGFADYGFPASEIRLDRTTHKFRRGGSRNESCLVWGWTYSLSSGRDFVYCIFGDRDTGEKYIFDPTAAFSFREQLEIWQRKNVFRAESETVLETFCDVMSASAGLCQ